MSVYTNTVYVSDYMCVCVCVVHVCLLFFMVFYPPVSFFQDEEVAAGPEPGLTKDTEEEREGEEEAVGMDIKRHVLPRGLARVQLNRA